MRRIPGLYSCWVCRYLEREIPRGAGVRQGDSDTVSDLPDGNRKGMWLVPLARDILRVDFVQDIPSRERREQAQPSSEPAPHRRGVGDTVPVLCHDSVDEEREYHSVHSGEPGYKSADAGTCSPT